MSINPQQQTPERSTPAKRPPESISLEWPVVVFDPSPGNGDALIPAPLRPDYFDTLKRVFVLLRADCALGREIHNLAQAHFGTRMPIVAPEPDGRGISQADLRAICGLKTSIDRLSFRIATMLHRGETPEDGELRVQQGWSKDDPFPQAPGPVSGYGNRYVDIDGFDAIEQPAHSAQGANCTQGHPPAATKPLRPRNQPSKRAAKKSSPARRRAS